MTAAFRSGAGGGPNRPLLVGAMDGTANEVAGVNIGAASMAAGG